jgi:NADH-quinone oxidoreductase subunit G
MEGVWQSQTAAAAPVGESRPGWKVLRVLGNLLNLAGFEYQSSEGVREELRKLSGEPAAASYKGSHRVAPATGETTLVDLPMYQIDALVRRAPSLQKTREGRTPVATY